jgi:hypothetical protein
MASIDYKIVLGRLLPNAKYRLSSSVPPHSIIEWRDARPQPSQASIDAEWATYEAEIQKKNEDDGILVNEILTKGKHYDALVDSVLIDVYLLEKS